VASSCCGGARRKAAVRRAPDTVVVFEVWGRDGSQELFTTLAAAKTASAANGGMVRSKLVAAGTPTVDSS
jgi:hypothetical protein